MCGIAGVVSYDQVVSSALIEAMCASIQSRGPDQTGVWTDTTAQLSVGLGVQRLKIIDLSDAGRQPMTNEDESLWLAYNGEIFNHALVRTRLEHLGHRYRSYTDTETLLHAYEEYGLEMLQFLNGMFGFALFDQKRQRLVIVRDQMGVKPLYYAWDGATLVFGSELKVVQTHPAVPRDFDETALSLYFSLQYVPSPHSIYSGIHKLPPGHVLILQNGQLTVEPYWTLPTTLMETPPDFKTLVEQTRYLVEQAVQRQLMSDVPLGTFLSGGVDSTTVTALAQKLHPGEVHSFAIGFAEANGELLQAEPEVNLDLLHAREAAAALGTHHHEVLLRLETVELQNALEAGTRYFDEPFGEPLSVLIHKITEAARAEGVTVLLSGDAGDELFAGYEVYSRLIDPDPRWQPTATAEVLHQLAPKNNLAYLMQHASFQSDALGSYIDGVLEPSSDLPLAEQMFTLDLKMRVIDNFNFRLDRMTMMHGVEGRVPLQDIDLVQFAQSIPGELKMQGGDTKAILKAAVADLIPERQRLRPKRPFAAPTTSWLKGPLKAYAEDALHPDALRRIGVLEPVYVTRCLRDFHAGRHQNSELIWTMVCFQRWAEAQRERAAFAV